MLTFESPFYEIEGIVVFRDHASPTTFHYLAGPPKLTRGPDGKPHLLLLTYRHALDSTATSPQLREQLGGAFLMFGVDCEVTPETKRTIARELSRMLPEETDADQISLVPVLYTAGRVDVIALDQQTAVETQADAADRASGKFVRGILGTATPSLLQHQRAIFSLSLTPDAAVLIEEAYQSDLSPIGVMYSLTFSGLRPALAVRAHVDQKRVYEQLKLGVHLGIDAGGGSQGGGSRSGRSSGSRSGTTDGSASRTGASADGAVTGAAGTATEERDGQAAGDGTAGAEDTTDTTQPVDTPEPTDTDSTDTTEPTEEATDAPDDGATDPTGESDATDATDGTDTGEADTGEADTGEADTDETDAGGAGGGDGGDATDTTEPSDDGQGGGGTATEGDGAAGGERQPAGGRSRNSNESGSTNVTLSVDLSFTLEKLEESGAVKIEIIRQQEGQSVDQMERNAMQLLQETILRDFYRPAMSNQTSGAGAAEAAGRAASTAAGLMATSDDTNRGQAGSGTSVDIGFQLKYIKQEELKEMTYTYDVTAPETRIHAPNGFFAALVTGTERDEHIRRVDLDDEFFKRLLVDVSTTGGFEELDLKVVKIDWKYDGKPVQTITCNPTPSPRAFFEEFLDGQDASYEYRLDYKFGQSEAVAAVASSYQAPWRRSVSRALVIHPQDDVAMLRVYIEPGVVDWEVVERIQTRLVYDDPAHQFHTERTYLVASGAARQEWTVRLADAARRTYQVQHVWHLKDHTEIRGDLETHDEAHLFIADPFTDRLPIVVQSVVDPENVRRIDVRLDYEDRDNDFEVHKTVRIDGPDFQQASTLIPIMNPRRRKYTYTVSLVKTSGQAEIHQPKTTDDLSIIVTEGGIYLEVMVTVLGDLAQLGVHAVQVDLRSEPLDGAQEKVESHLFMPGAEMQVTKRLLLRADRPSQFEYRTVVFDAQGQREGDWTQHASRILVLQPQTLIGG